MEEFLGIDVALDQFPLFFRSGVLGFTGFYWVLLGFTGFHSDVVDFSWFSWNRPGVFFQTNVWVSLDLIVLLGTATK